VHDPAVVTQRAARLEAEIERLKTQRAAYRDRLEAYKTRVASMT
jgi:uncharacterized small protein (DUF1192 family)